MRSSILIASLPALAAAATSGSASVAPAITSAPVLNLFFGPTSADEYQIGAVVVERKSDSTILKLGCIGDYDERTCGFPRTGLDVTYWGTTSFVAATTVAAEVASDDDSDDDRSRSHSRTESRDTRSGTYAMTCSAYPTISQSARGVCTRSAGYGADDDEGQVETIRVPARYSYIPVTVTSNANLLSGAATPTPSSNGTNSGSADSTDSVPEIPSDAASTGSSNGTATGSNSTATDVLDQDGAGVIVGPSGLAVILPAAAAVVAVMMSAL